jgi:6-phosphogluconolactonase
VRIIPLLLAASLLPPAAGADLLMYVGTYTKDKSKGIYAYHFDPATGKAVSLGLAAETRSPSWLTLSPNHRFLYAANESGDGALSAFSLDRKTGKLTALNTVPSKGKDPCHVSVDKAGKTLYDANYSGGNIISYPLNPDGSIGNNPTLIEHKGSSTTERQKGPHPHSVNISPDGRFVLVPDLGLDQVLAYKLDLKPSEPAFTKLKPGTGPRHLAFAPNGKFAYVIGEIGSTVTAFTYDAKNGSMSEIQNVSTLPQGFSGENNDAEVYIHPSGKFLYASNRGHNSIAVFTIDPKGMLNAVQDVPTEGKIPRSFGIDPTGQWLLAANQDTDNIVTFRIDKSTGKLTPSGQVLDVGAPVCVLFVK